LEKPLCATVEEGERLRSAVKASLKIVSVGYQWSFSEAVGSLKRDIISGSLGAPLELRTLVLWPRKISYYKRNSWAGRIKTDSGAWVLDSPLNNAAAHFLHHMLYVLGSDAHSALVPEEIRGELYRANDIENYDTAAIEMKTKSGALLRMYVSHAVPYERGPRFSFRFENATVTYGEDKRIVARFKDGREKVYGDPDQEYFAKIRRTIDAIRTGVPVPCDAETALAHTYCVNRIQEFPVQPFPQEKIRIQNLEDDSLVWVEGLAEELEQRYGQ
jgi:predicted dehydrogenase